VCRCRRDPGCCGRFGEGRSCEPDPAPVVGGDIRGDRRGEDDDGVGIGVCSAGLVEVTDTGIDEGLTEPVPLIVVAEVGGVVVEAEAVEVEVVEPFENGGK